MLKRILILLVLILAQTGCTLYEEHGFYQPAPFKAESVQYHERLKRDLLQLEDLTVGEGPVAASGRKVIAEIVVKYSDGTLIYEGPAITYWGMIGDVFIHNNVRERGLLSTQQLGIVWGLNGMAVGGKRRIVVSPNLVCYEGAAGQSLDKGADPNSKCGLIIPIRGEIGARVRKESLIVEATLTASCTPIFLRIPLIYSGQFRCRDSDAPKRESGDPIWRFYHATPALP